MNPKNPQAASEYAWEDGAPSQKWFDEWFIAETVDGDRVVLRRLPEEYTYDFTTADHTYIMAARIKRWMQFPDSEFKPLAATPANAGAVDDAYWIRVSDWNRIVMEMPLGEDAYACGHSAALDAVTRAICSFPRPALAPAAQQEGAVRAATREEEAEIDDAAELTKVAFRMPDDLLGVVDAQAAREGLIRVAMIRTLIKRGLSSENVVAPADPPAAGDVRVVVADLRRLGKEDGWLCATAGADIIEELRQQLAAALAERDELRALIDTPHTSEWFRAVRFEAAHQIKRWGASHDAGKAPHDWFWLIGYLAGKALHAAITGDDEKAKHHTISTGAALLNWFRAMTGDSNAMRPGIDDAAIAAGGEETSHG